jgi:hypothetical protein
MEFKRISPSAAVHSVLPQPYAALFMIIEVSPGMSERQTAQSLISAARNHLRGTDEHVLRPRCSLCIHGTRPMFKHNSRPDHNSMYNTTNQSNAVLSHGCTGFQRRHRASSSLCCYLQAPRPTRQPPLDSDDSCFVCCFRHLSCRSGNRRLGCPGSAPTSGRVQHLFGDQLLGSVVVVAGSICLVLPHGKQVERILKIHVALAPRDVSRQCISSDKSTYVEEVT